MIMSMTYAPEDRPNPTEFTVNVGPWIIVATIILPAPIAGWLASKKRRGEHLLTADEEPASGGNYILDHLYRALVLPLVVLAQLGVVIGIGVLLDTLLVRTVLVPSLVVLLGERFWWPRRVR